MATRRRRSSYGKAKGHALRSIGWRHPWLVLAAPWILGGLVLLGLANGARRAWQTYPHTAVVLAVLCVLAGASLILTVRRLSGRWSGQRWAAVGLGITGLAVLALAVWTATGVGS